MYVRQWHYVETTPSGQPILRENEKDVYVEHSVGLYQGKSKVKAKQKGRAYLTSQRLIYIDDVSPTSDSVSLELDDISGVEYSSKFLKKSAKLIIFLKEQDNDSTCNVQEPKPIKSQWICPICMMGNETNGEIDGSHLPLPACMNCGISPDYEMIKNSISTLQDNNDNKAPSDNSDNVCPACTFINHSLMSNCEICGTRLPAALSNSGSQSFIDSRLKIELEGSDGLTEGEKCYIQLSFRKSDGVLLYQSMDKVLKEKEREKTLNVFNKGASSINGVEIERLKSDFTLVENKMSQVGIAGLEKTQENQLIRNDILMNNALSDLNNLMALASDIEKLYGAANKPEDKNKTPLLIIDREKFLNKSQFIDEIAREIYGFIMSEFKEQKEKDGVILITLVDIYALYNKSMRIGTGLISPQELREACEKFEKLGLNELRLIRINGRVLCISSGNSFEFVKTKIIEIVSFSPGADLLRLTQSLNENNSNSWTMGIIMEVLQNCVNEGDLLIDEQISGIHYYMNSDWKI